MSRTSSIRISEELYERLERFVTRSSHGKNWVIVRALEEYLNRKESESLAKEARRQSLLASAQLPPDDIEWLERADETGWK